MNVRVMTTNDLLQQWMIKNTPREAADLIWDELYRRCHGVPISFSRYGQYRLYLLDGKKSLEFTIAITAEFLDAKFLETPPEPTDGLAFEPSDELDAATLAT